MRTIVFFVCAVVLSVFASIFLAFTWELWARDRKSFKQSTKEGWSSALEGVGRLADLGQLILRFLRRRFKHFFA
ncbi:hypothetical protein HYW53_03885 [Candidatus Giovannonibacteria bacterium]|nr:hypothetical protein [Candidatus Giovannonibacteria bacterium]